MLNDRLQNALNEQIKHEFESAYLYLSMSAYGEAQDMPGFAHWMRMQHQEETHHAMRLYDFVHERGGWVELLALAQPRRDFGSLLEMMRATLEHERLITSRIHGLYELATGEKDFAAQMSLHWFITEQVEEEKAAHDIIVQLERAGDDPALLMMIDQQMAQRRPPLPPGEDA